MNNKAGRKKGHILALTLLVMMVGAIIMAVFFQYLGASLALAIRGEERANTYYAADSGFEDGFYWLQQGKELGGFWSWNEGGAQWQRENYELNDRTVQVGVEDTGDDIYKITSRAISDAGRNTVIESYIYAPEGSSILAFGEYAISSSTAIIIQPGSIVTGNISVPDGNENRVYLDPEGTLNGLIEPVPEPWPNAAEVAAMFWDDVSELTPYAWDTIDVDATPNIGPLYRDGDLEIISSVNSQSYASLDGTVYVTGGLKIGRKGRDFTLNLNGHVIFVHGTIDVGDRCTLEGRGSIIALDNIFFGPKTKSQMTDFIFIMSIEGEVQLNPNGLFYGAVAGYGIVKIQDGVELNSFDSENGGYGMPAAQDIQILTYNIVD